MATEDVQTNLRLPADLKDRLVASAAENNRSLSAEVTSRLEGSYEADDGFALILDQSKQIKELRAKVMESNFVMAQAFRVLTGLDNDRDACVQALSTLMQKTTADATEHFKALLNEHLSRTGQTPEEWMKASQAELDESRAKKPKP